MSVVLYIADLMCGAVLIFALGAVMSASAGVGSEGAILLFAPFALFGFASGLSLLSLRWGSLLSLALVLPFELVSFVSLVQGSWSFDLIFFLVPALLVTALAMIGLAVGKRSTWSKAKGRLGKAAIGIAAGLPAILVISFLISFFSQVTFRRNT